MPEAGDRDLARYLWVLLQEKLNVVRLDKGRKKQAGELSLRDAAHELGIANLSEIINGGKGVGQKVERIIARRWFGNSVDALHQAASAWAAEHPPIVEPVNVERVLAIAEGLVDKGQDPSLMLRVRAVTAELAAAKGEILDEEIASRLLGKRVDEGRPAERLRKKRPTRS